MVNNTLNRATEVSTKIDVTIRENNSTIQKYDQENEKIDKKCSEMLETEVRSQL